MDFIRNNKLQELCRYYLSKLRYMAKKHGIGEWLDGLIRANERKTCVATEKEVTMLSRLCNDERIARMDIHKMLGISYRECNENGAFDKIKKLPHVGTYSKVSAELFGEELKEKKKKKYDGSKNLNIN